MTLEEPTTSSVSGRVGALTYSADTPLTVGGKVTRRLAIMSSADQFQGLVDHAFLRVG